MQANLRMFVGVSAVALMLPLMAMSANVPKDLGTLGGTFSAANAVNFEHGVVGASTTGNDAAQHAFLRIWVREREHEDNDDDGQHFQGKLIDLGTLSGGTNSDATAINALYEVVGTSDYNDPFIGIVSHAFKYERFTGMTDLGTLGGSTSRANGVDLEGVIVGSSTLTGDTATHAFYYKPGASSLTDLGSLAGPGGNSKADAINITGLVSGRSQTGELDSFGSPFTHAVIFDIFHNKTIDLGSLGGTTAEAYAINNFGVVTGTATISGDLISHAFVSVSGKLKDIGTLGGSAAQGTAINDFGVVVGFSNITGDTDVHAFIWTADRGMVDLNSLIPANSGWVLNSANGINAEGHIVGTGIHNGESRAFIL